MDAAGRLSRQEITGSNSQDQTAGTGKEHNRTGKADTGAGRDMLVSGAARHGAAAAIAASRAGAETHLVERYNHLGDCGPVASCFLCSPPMLWINRKNGNRSSSVWAVKWAQRLKDLGMSEHEFKPVIDPEAGKYVLDEMIRESELKMLSITPGSPGNHGWEYH